LRRYFSVRNILKDSLTDVESVLNKKDMISVFVLNKGV